MYNALFSYLREKDVEYKGNLKLSSISYVRIGGSIDAGVFPDTRDKLIDVLRYLYKNGYPFCVIGRMTNLLADDRDYCGVAVFTSKIKGYEVRGNHAFVECGVMLSQLITRLCDLSLGGLESLFGIPGTLGGMIYSNAGAFETEISDFLVSAEVYDVKMDKIITFGKESLRMSYRHSMLSEDKYKILLSATLSLSKKESDRIKADLRAVISKRKSSQPYNEPSLGSVFKRCEGAPVSGLIDACGLKGYSVGGAEISKKHAGFIVNRGNATSDDYKRLINHIKDKIFQNYGLRIEEEIEYLSLLP